MTEQEIEKIVSELVNHNFEISENDLYNHPNPENTIFNLLLDDNIKELQIQLQDKNFSYVQDNVNSIKSKMTILDEDLELIQSQLMSKTIDALKTLRNNINEELYTKPRKTNKTAVKSTLSGHKLGIVAKEFIKHTNISKNWSSDTKKTNELICNVMMKYFGDVDISSISRKNILDFRDVLIRLPKNHTIKRFKSVNYEDICNVAEDEDLELISDKTVNKYLQVIKNVFELCVLNDYIIKNPCMEVNLKVDKTSYRTVFNDEEMTVLDKIMIGETTEERMIYLIAKMCGMRLKEITQLCKDDIKINDGVMFIDINRNNGKTTKNVASIRLVPIHPLIEKDFKIYVDSRKDKNLFTYDNKKYSKYFRMNIKDKVSTDKNKVFYSLRHNFANELVQANVRSEHIASLMGHAQENDMTMTTYAEKINVKLLKEQIEKIYT